MIKHVIKYFKDAERDGETLMLIGAIGIIFFMGYMLGVFMGVTA